MTVTMHWASDGSAIRDLSQAHYVESVRVEEEAGGMVGMGTGVVQSEEDYALLDIMPWDDVSGRPMTGVHGARSATGATSASSVRSSALTDGLLAARETAVKSPPRLAVRRA